MNITLKQLEVFCLVAQTGSISAASQKIFLTQPATSMALKQLEATLEKPLFDRKGKKLILNDFGKQQLEKAQQIIERSKHFTANTNDLQTLRGDLNIGASLTIGNYILPEILAYFKKAHPQVNIYLTIENTQQLESNLLKFNYDLILHEGETSNHSLIQSKQWRKDRLVMIASSNHPLTKKSRITKKDLEKYPWAFREKGSGTLDLLEKTLLQTIQPTEAITMNGFEGIKHYVAASQCLSCLSESTLDLNSHAKIKKLAIPSLKIERQLKIAWHTQKYLSECVLAFLKMLDGLKT